VQKVNNLSQFTVAVSYVGMEVWQQSIQTASLKDSTVLRVQLKQVQSTIGEVVVSANNSLLRQIDGKTIYNVLLDPTRNASNLYQLLPKIPGVSLTSEGTISVNGARQVLLLINGRVSGLFSGNLSQILKSFPGGSVRQIEVSSIVPLRFQSDGVDAVINIVLDTRINRGYNSNLNVDLKAPTGLGVNDFLTAKRGAVGFTGTASYDNARQPVSSNEDTFEDLNSAMIWSSRGLANSRNSNFNFQGEFVVELDSLNFLSMSGSSARSSSVTLMDQSTELNEQKTNIKTLYRNGNHSLSSSKNEDVQLDYKRQFTSSPEKEFSASYKYLRNANSYSFNMENFIGTDSLVDRLNSGNTESFHEQTIQVDFAVPAKKVLYELGVKSIFRKSFSDYFVELFQSDISKFVRDPSQTNRFLYNQIVSSGYSSVRWKIEKNVFRLSLKADQVSVKANFTSDSTQASKNYFYVMPALRWTSYLSSKTSLNVSYMTRVQRPGITYLNPFVNISEGLYHYFGNPNLNPAITHSVNIRNTTLIGKLFLSLDADISFSNNGIQSYMYTGSDNIIRSTYGNIGKSRNCGLSMSASQTISQKFSFNASGSARFLTFNSNLQGVEVSKTGVTYSGSLYLSADLVKNVFMSAVVSYSSGSVQWQGAQSKFISSGITMSKQFGKKLQSTINLSVQNPVFNNQEQLYSIQQTGIRSVSITRTDLRSLVLSYALTFGELNGTVKRKQSRLVNDDQL